MKCVAESAIVNMLYRLQAALNKLCSKSRCMSHWQPASAAEDTVSRFLNEAFSSRNMTREREREREIGGGRGSRKPHLKRKKTKTLTCES